MSKIGGRLHTMLAEGAAIGPMVGFCHPAIAELQPNLHGIAAITDDPGDTVRVFQNGISSVVDKKPGEPNSQQNDKSHEKSENRHIYFLLLGNFTGDSPVPKQANQECFLIESKTQKASSESKFILISS